MKTETSYILTLDKQKQIQLEKLIEKYEAYPVGTGYIDIIVLREKYSAFIDDLSKIGLMIEGVSWWCHATDDNKNSLGCPHGYGGPMTKFGWFSEMSHDFDSFENEILISIADKLNQFSVEEINDKAKNLIENKRTITYADGSYLTFKENPCLTPGLWIYVPDNWERELK